MARDATDSMAGDIDADAQEAGAGHGHIKVGEQDMGIHGRGHGVRVCSVVFHQFQCDGVDSVTARYRLLCHRGADTPHYAHLWGVCRRGGIGGDVGDSGSVAVAAVCGGNSADDGAAGACHAAGA